MSDTAYVTTAEQTSPGKRPRVLFSDHMVVFATNGLRHSLLPSRMWADGFDSFVGHIYAAGPQELAPENHEALKGTLTRKLDEAKAMPLSKREQGIIRDSFFEDVVEKLAYTRPGDIIPYLSKFDEATRKAYPNEAAIKKADKDAATGHFNGYHLRERLLKAFDDNKAAYKQLRILFKNKHLDGLFFDTELDAAQKQIEGMLLPIDLPDEKKQRIIKQSVAIKQAPSGEKRISIDTRPLQQLHRELISEQYKNIDKTIESARAMLVKQATENKTETPFENTIDESVVIDRIHDIAHRDIRAKPVVLAGYADEDLTIIVENQRNRVFSGRSYPGQNLIQAVLSAGQGNHFDTTLTEELLHQGTDKIYRNFSLPYINDQDPRKLLLEEAISFDIVDEQHLSSLTIAPIFHYNVDDTISMHQEIPIKVLTYMDDPQKELLWGSLPRGVASYPALETFAAEVLIKDAVAYNAGQPLPAINMDFERSDTHFQNLLARKKGGLSKDMGLPL